jgi:hypothetical protein
VSANAAPVAVAGLDQNLRAGATVSLDGSGSFDDNTESSALVYAWSFLSRPEESSATLIGADTATPSFVADLAGTYEIQLVVTDEAGLSSVADHVICSSGNLAPTAVAMVDFNLLIVGQTAHFDASASSDPEPDPLSFAWAITSRPAASTASLIGADTATPSLTPDVEGVYQLTLVASDFIGPGSPTTIQITATTAAGYAEVQIVNASDIISSLTIDQFTNQNHATPLLNFLTQAVEALQAGDTAVALDRLGKAIERTDGCVLRGSVDGAGPGAARDWITDCTAQADVYSAIHAAINALTP